MKSGIIKIAVDKLKECQKMIDEFDEFDESSEMDAKILLIKLDSRIACSLLLLDEEDQK